MYNSFPQLKPESPAQNKSPDITDLYIHLDRYIRTVLMVAEERQVTRAAARLHVAQPWVSRQVHEVEAVLGIRLFDRLHDGLRLTRGGCIFVQEARRGIFHLDRAVIKARAIENFSEIRFHVAFSPTFAPSLSLRALDRLKAALPKVHFEVFSQFNSEQVHHLLSSEVHIGFVELPLNSDELTVFLLKREKLRLAASLGDPLLLHEGMTPERMNQKPCVILNSHANHWQRQVVDGLVKRGMAATNVREVLTVPEVLTLVSTGRFFAVLPAFAETFSCEGSILFRELDGLYCDYGFAHEQDSQHPLAKQVVSILLDEFAVERMEAERILGSRRRSGPLNGR